MSELDREIERMFVRDFFPSRASRLKDILRQQESFSLPLISFDQEPEDLLEQEESKEDDLHLKDLN